MTEDGCEKGAQSQAPRAHHASVIRHPSYFNNPFAIVASCIFDVPS